MIFPDVRHYHDWDRDERFQGFLLLFWLLLAAPALVWWRESVPFLVFCSVYANFAYHLSGWRTAHNSREVRKGQTYEGRNDA